MFRIRYSLAVLALAAVAAAVPALASAHLGPGDVVTPQTTTQPTAVQLDQIDRLGPKYVPVDRHNLAATPHSVTNWTLDGTAIGAAVLVIAALTWMLARRRRHDVSPDAGTAVRA